MSFKSGFINVIGRPNTGKSTLINNLIKEKLSITNSKAQTTRHRIFGIYTGDDYQMIFSDTPGIITPNYKLQDAMMQSIKDVYIDGDILILLVGPNHTIEHLEIFIEKFNKADAVKFLVLNKCDLIEKEEQIELLEYWKTNVKCDEYFLVSALESINTELLFERIKERLPEHPAYYPEDQLTDRSERFIVSEIVRDKILSNYQNEIPYSVDVQVEAFQEEEDIIRILANIISGKKSHKSILIGKGGSKLKKVGTEARKDMEEFFGKKIYLELYVKIKEDWRNNDNLLRQMGYTE